MRRASSENHSRNWAEYRISPCASFSGLPCKKPEKGTSLTISYKKLNLFFLFWAARKGKKKKTSPKAKCSGQVRSFYPGCGSPKAAPWMRDKCGCATKPRRVICILSTFTNQEMSVTSSSSVFLSPLSSHMCPRYKIISYSYWALPET